MTTNLYIIRHGEAVCNVEAMHGGAKGCRGLTERGHQQAARLGERLRGGEIKADVLYASTLRRARETANVVGEALGLPINWDDELQEIRPGEADSMTYEEADARFGGFDLHQPYRVVSPGGESFATFTARASTALDRLVRQHAGQSIVVVAHGGIIEASFYLMLGLSPATITRGGFGPDHTSITHWRSNDSEPARWFLQRFNDATHLADFKLTEQP